MPISLAQLESIVREAGALALARCNDLQRLEITRKGARDLVTDVDVEIETFLRGALARHHPDYGFWGEENGRVGDQSRRWVVDPIDGTHSFSKGQYFWSVSVALEFDGEVVAGAVFAPALDDYYCATQTKGAWKNGQPIRASSETRLSQAMVATGFACLRADLEDNNLDRFCRIAQRTMGQRRFGSAALDLCLVADGQLDAYWEQNLNLYDIAAGALIAREAGAAVTDFRGRPGIVPQQVVAANPTLLEQLLPLM